MKKVLYFAVAGLLLLGACTKKDDAEQAVQKPSISWVGNDNFSAWDIKENIFESDSKVVVSCPEGIAALTVTATVPSLLRYPLIQMIGVSANKQDQTKLKLDLLADKTAVNKLVGIRFLSSSAVTSPCTLDFDALISFMRENIDLANGDTFTFVIQVKDKKDNSLSKTAVFKWTSAPEISFTPAIEGAIPISLDADLNNAFTINAPGKIESVRVSFTAKGDKKSDAGILAYLKQVMGDDRALSLLDENDAKVAKRAGFDYDATMYGKTGGKVALDNFLGNLSLQTEGGNTYTEMIITVTDQLGKVLIESVDLNAL